MATKWTVKPRRGIAHLFRELLTDTDHGLLDEQHPMYRRLSKPEKAELRALIEWLQVEQEDVPPRPKLLDYTG